MRKRNLSLMSTVLAAALSASMLICAIPVSAADARLASNSLLESLVFAEKAAQHIAGKEGLE